MASAPKKMKTIERPPTMAELRAKNWKRFGEATSNPGDLIAKDKPVFLELGSIDAQEKIARDEVMGLMHMSLGHQFSNPKTRLLEKKLEELKSQGASDAVLPTTSNSMSSPTSSTPGGEKGLTWAAASKAKKESTATAGPGARDKGKGFEHNVIRVQNLVDSISVPELYRIFGTDNGLGKIERFFQPKFGDGDRKPFAYITYHSAAEADAAVKKMNRMQFKNVILEVDYGTDPNAPMKRR